MQHTDTAAKNTMYWHGDLAEYTGKVVELHGGTFYEIKMVEGHRSGHLLLTAKAPGGAA